MTEPSALAGGEGYEACDDAVRVERRGKSSPAAWRHVGAVNSIRSNAVEEHTGRPGRSREAA